VLNYLFIPAVQQAGFNPIPPKRKGSENIQAEIIRHLEHADMVLCDISCYNPNVFFELGCRTALNKPVCYVKDTLTLSIPFDSGTISHHTYNGKLSPWIIEKEIPTLKDHLLESQKSSKGENSLWKYFGLRNVAKPSEGIGDTDSKLELIGLDITSVKDMINSLAAKNISSISAITEEPSTYAKSTRFEDYWFNLETNDRYEKLIRAMYELFKRHNATLSSIYQSGKRKLRFDIKANKDVAPQLRKDVASIADDFGFTIDIRIVE
jgi:hypothetical protein